MPNEKTKEEYNPISCDHKKPSGFSAFDLLSHSSGSGPNSGHECNISVCLLCGEVKVSGKKLVDGKWNYFHEEFSLYYPDAVAAIVKNCNYMNTETDGYAPFTSAKVELTKKVNYSKEIEAAMSVEEIRLVNMLAEKEPSCYADIAAIILEQTASQTPLIAELQKWDDLNTAKIAEQTGEIERLKGENKLLRLQMYNIG